jgi:hypothetical protein
MTVLTGLSKLFAAGYDLTGDINSIGGIKGGPALWDASSLDLAGMKRLAARFDGSMALSVLFDPDVAHVPLSALPTTAVPLMVPIPGSAAGDYAAMLVGKYVDYAPSIGADLGVMFALSVQASEGYPVEWGRMITAGKRTDTGATSTGTGITLPLPPGVAAVAITSATAASPTEVTATAHGLQSGDSVLIAGTDQATLNDEWTVTVTGDDTFTVPCDLSVAGAASGGTVQRTSYRGWAAQVQVFSVTGTSMTVTVQDAHEAVSGSFANLTGGGFAAVNAGSVGAERIASAAGIVRNHVRVKTTGTFNPGVFAVAIHLTPD